MYTSGLAASIAGVIAMGYVVIGLLFRWFSRRTRDRLFMIFAVAFWLLAINYGAFPFCPGRARAKTHGCT